MPNIPPIESGTATDAALTPPPPTAANQPLGPWAQALPKLHNNKLLLGGSERSTAFVLSLTVEGGCYVELDAEGRVLSLRWEPNPEGFSGTGFADGLARMPFPLLLMRRAADAILLSDLAALIVGDNGIALKNAAGAVEFIAVEEIHGVAYQPPVSPPHPK